MIDLSHLTEEEQEMIMAVIKRDSELKKVEEERVKQWENLGAEEDRLKYITGKWFYEAKSQRHQDKIHGSDIILASMKQKKPMRVESSTHSLRERPSKSVDSTVMPKPESGDALNERGPSEAEQNGLNFSKRSPSRPRHNPFNMLPMNPDFDFTDGTTEPEAENPSVTAGMPLPLQTHEAAEMETKNNSSDMLQETAPSQKPVPKMRTKLFRPQNSAAESTSPMSTQGVSESSSNTSTVSTLSLSAISDSMSTVSTQSMSSNPGMRYPPLGGILKRSYSSSSSDSKTKSQLPRPVRPSRTNSGTDFRQILEEHTVTKESTEESHLNKKDQEPVRASSPLRTTLPKSRLPIRSSLPLNNPTQTEQSKPTAHPRLSLRSSTWTSDEQKTTDTFQSPKQNHENSSHLRWPASSAEPDKQHIPDNTPKDPRYIPRIKVRSPLEALLDKPLHESPTLELSLQKLEGQDNKMSKKENEHTQKQEDHPHNTQVHLGYGPKSTSHVFHKADAFPRCENSYSPPLVDINVTGQNKLKTEDDKGSVVVDSLSPKSIEEQGDSIAKVLEWFSKSTDSSDILDFEDSDQEIENNTKFEDSDFEDEVIQETKPVNNVYLIIPKQRDEKTGSVGDSFLKELEQTEELSDNEQEPFRQTHGVRELPDLSNASYRAQALPVMGSSTFYTSEPQNGSPNEKEPEMGSKKEERRNGDQMEMTDCKVSKHELKEGIEESQPPTISSLKSFWEKGATEAPRVLVSRSNENTENENKVLDQTNTVRCIMDGEKNPPKTDANSKSVVAEIKETLNVEQGNIIQDTTGKGKSHEIQSSVSNSKPIKDILVMNPISDTVGTTVLHQKPSSPLIDSCFLVESSEVARKSMSDDSTEGEHITKTHTQLNERTRTKETEPNNTSPISGIPTQHPNPVPLTNQDGEQQDNREERIKELKSFWEKETGKPKVRVQSSLTRHDKLKRFTKSEYDLTSIGTAFEEEDQISPHFTILPLRERMDNLGTAEGMNSSQFKSLRDFWAGTSSKQSPVFESKIPRPLNREVKHTKNQNQNQGAKNSFTQSGNQSGNINPPTPEGGPQSPVQARTFATAPESGPKANICEPSDELDSQSQKGSQSPVSDSSLAKAPGMLKKESRQQSRMSSKGPLHGRGNSLRRATSMFEMNMEVDDGGQDLPLQPEKVSDTGSPQVRNSTERSISASRKTSETNQQANKSPESPKRRQKSSETRPSRSPENSDSQPLARSFIPQDYQHYLGITESSGMYILPEVTEQTGGLVCTPFTSSPERCSSIRCSPEQCSTPIGSPELHARKGSKGLHSSPHTIEDGKALNNSDSWSHSRTSQHSSEENPIQGALRRASTRPAYHKSLEDIIAVPRRFRKSNGMGDSMSNDWVSSSPSPPSSSFSDMEQMRKLSKSVPSFLDNENDGGESDSASEHSAQNVKRRKNRPHPNYRSNSGMASASSVSGSIMSVSSGDFTNIEVQGTIDFSLNYVQKLREFHIFVIRCQNLAAVDAKKNRSDPYVKSYLTPDSARLGKRKTSVKKKTLNPIYNEILRYRVRMESLKTQVLNLSVWHNDMFGRNSFLGETEVDLSTWDFENTKINSLSLKPRFITSIQPTDYRGEMRLAIRFLPQISQSMNVFSSGEIHIWVKDCKNLPLIRGASVDPYVKCFVLPDTSKKSRQKTRVLKRIANPVFNHTMVYDGFTTEDLKEACVELSVWDRDRLADHLLGVLRLGLGTGQSYGVKVDWMDSTSEEVELWERMMGSPNEWVEDVLPLRMATTSKSKRK